MATSKEINSVDSFIKGGQLFAVSRHNHVIPMTIETIYCVYDDEYCFKMIPSDKTNEYAERQVRLLFRAINYYGTQGKVVGWFEDSNVFADKELAIEKAKKNIESKKEEIKRMQEEIERAEKTFK